MTRETKIKTTLFWGIFFLAFFTAYPCAASRQSLTVGTGKTYSTVKAAVAAAVAGDTIEIDAGDYTNQPVTITQSNLTIKGVDGNAHITGCTGNQGGTIYFASGSNLTLINLELSGATNGTNNGAGVRMHSNATGLTIKNCYIHDNQDGILTGDNTSSDILIESTEFNHNGAGDGQSHNIYIGNQRTFTLEYSWVHRAVVGHQVKSRAQANYILYNRIMDEDGNGSASVDLPNGGLSYVIGNEMEKGPNCDSNAFLAYGQEVDWSVPYTKGGATSSQYPDWSWYAGFQVVGETSGQTANFSNVFNTSGDWTSQTAAGIMWLSGLTASNAGNFISGEGLKVSSSANNPSWARGVHLCTLGTLPPGAIVCGGGKNTPGWTWNCGTGNRDFYVINNSIVNDHNPATNPRCGAADAYVYMSHSDTSLIKSQNNAMIDMNGASYGGLTITGAGQTPTFVNDFVGTANPGFTNVSGYDYSLTSSATSLINQGSSPGSSSVGYSLTPTYEYLHPLSNIARPVSGALDIGAYEYPFGADTTTNHPTQKTSQKCRDLPSSR